MLNLHKKYLQINKFKEFIELKKFIKYDNNGVFIKKDEKIDLNFCIFKVLVNKDGNSDGYHLLKQNYPNYFHDYTDNCSRLYGYLLLKDKVKDLILINNNYNEKSLIVEIIKIINEMKNFKKVNIQDLRYVYFVISITYIDCRHGSNNLRHLNKFLLKNGDINEMISKRQAKRYKKYFANELNIVNLLISNNINLELDQYYDNIYLSRLDSKKRVCENENEIIDLVKKYGFTSLLMSNYTLQQKIALLKKAKNIITHSGATITNLFFCKNKKIMSFITKYDSITNFQKQILFKNNNNVLIVNKTHITNMDELEKYGHQRFRHYEHRWKVNIDVLENKIKRFFK